MNIHIDQRIATFSTLTVLLLSACNGQLAVVDDLKPRDVESQDFEPSGGPVNAPLADAHCTCDSSDALQALDCGNGELYGNLEMTADGSVVAFGLKRPNLTFDVFYWRSNAATLVVAHGLLSGLSATGRDVLVDSFDIGDGEGLLRISPDRTTEVGLGRLPGSGLLSADGGIVLGAYAVDKQIALAQANANTGEIEVLGHFSTGIGTLIMNADASVLVGALGGIPLVEVDGRLAGQPSGADEDYAAFRWSEQGLSFGLPGVPASARILPEALSGNGSVIAGRATVPSAVHFLWSESDGYIEIASASSYTETQLSADGSVVLGSLDPEGASITSTFRWTKATGAVEIAPGTTTGNAYMSGDGNVIVTSAWAEPEPRGMPSQDTLIWDPVHGARSLEEILRLRGVDASGWEFEGIVPSTQERLGPLALSDNGKVLLGRGTCSGVPAIYRVVLSED
jgi:hypothetical protein